MNGDPVAGKERAAESAEPKLSRGLETLVGKDESPASLPERKPSLLPAWFFFAADLLLLGFTVAVLFDTPKPLAWQDWLFCTIVTAVAGLLGIIGVLVSGRQQP